MTFTATVRAAFFGGGGSGVRNGRNRDSLSRWVGDDRRRGSGWETAWVRVEYASALDIVINVSGTIEQLMDVG